MQMAFMESLNITQADAADYPFLANNQIYRLDLAQNSRGSSDQFGRAVFRPDLLLADLKAAVSGNANANRTFLRNIAEGEQPMYITGAECEAGCNAFETQEPLPLGTTAAAAGAAGGGAVDGDGATLGGTGGAAPEQDADAGAALGTCAVAAGAAIACVAALV